MRVCSAVRIVIIRIFIFKIKDFNQIYLEIRPTVVSGVDRHHWWKNSKFHRQFFPISVGALAYIGPSMPSTAAEESMMEILTSIPWFLTKGQNSKSHFPPFKFLFIIFIDS